MRANPFTYDRPLARAEEQTGRGRSTLANRRRALVDRAALVEEAGRMRAVDPFLARFASS